MILIILKEHVRKSVSTKLYKIKMFNINVPPYFGNILAYTIPYYSLHL